MSAEDHPVFPHTWSVGDILPAIAGVLKGVDITGWTVELHVDRPTTVLVKAATIVDAAQGQFSVDWIATDLVAGRRQLAVWRMTNASAEPQTPARMFINVEELPA